MGTAFLSNWIVDLVLEEISSGFFEPLDGPCERTESVFICLRFCGIIEPADYLLVMAYESSLLKVFAKGLS